MIKRSKDNSNLLPLKKLNGNDDMKLFEVSGVDYDSDTFSYLRVAESEDELRNIMQKESDEDDCYAPLGCVFVREIKEIDGYEISLSKIK